MLAHFSNFSLSFCDSYTISDLLLGMANPDGLNCSLRNMMWDLGRGGADDDDVCSGCIQAYARLDQHAQEKYEEFDFLFLKYLSGDYSVRSHTEDCKSVYKAWLCSEYFSATQTQCHHRIPCKQYCLEVQTKCPFVLPDNDDLVYGERPVSSVQVSIYGLLEEDHVTGGPECCDVRWSSCSPVASGGCNASTGLRGSFPRQRRPVSAAARLGGGAGGKLRLCVLVLFLLQTVVSFSAVQDNGGVAMETSLEEGSAREE